MVIGQSFSKSHTFSQAEFNEFACLSGDDNPIHVDPYFAAKSAFGRPVAHGMLLYGIICGLINQHFPTAVQIEQQLMFPAPTFAGEKMNIGIEITHHDDERVTLNTVIIRESGVVTCEGEAVLLLGIS